MSSLFLQSQNLLDEIGYMEEPLGVLYSDSKPDTPGPRMTVPLSIEDEISGKIEQQSIRSHFSCLMGRVLSARKKRVETWLAADAYGCPGASHFAGFLAQPLEQTIHYISVGIPGIMEGERFLPSVDSARTFFRTLHAESAPKPYCVIKPLSLFRENEEPVVVVFFAKGELLCALCALTAFTTGEVESVVMPFGAGCTNILAWPLHYHALGMNRAVLGGNDIACRSFYKLDELSFAVPAALFKRMIEAAPESFIKTEAWTKVKKRILESYSSSTLKHMEN
jgi:hypothetical protein